MKIKANQKLCNEWNRLANAVASISLLVEQDCELKDMDFYRYVYEINRVQEDFQKLKLKTLEHISK